MHTNEKRAQKRTGLVQSAKGSSPSSSLRPHEALFLGLQRAAGNEAVSGLIEAPPLHEDGIGLVVARSPAATHTKLRTRPDNDKRFLGALPVEKLLSLYVTEDVVYSVEWEGSSASYDHDFIQDKEKSYVERILKQKLKTETRTWEETDVLLSYIAHIPGNDDQKKEARGMVLAEYQMIAGAPLAEKEETALRENAKFSIKNAVDRFGKACQKQKEELRAQIAEEKERNELIFSFIEIGFSFVPGAPAVVKGLEKLGEKKELAAKAVEASLKLVQMGLKAYVSSHQTGGEDFIDQLDKQAQQIATAAMDHIDQQTDAEVQNVRPYYDNLEQEDFEQWIAEQVLRWKKSVGHLGETRHWEFQPSELIKTKGELALLETDKAKPGFALITTLGSQQYFLDWIPKDMVEMAKQKWFDEYGDWQHLGQGQYEVPKKYSERFRSGPPN